MARWSAPVKAGARQLYLLPDCPGHYSYRNKAWGQWGSTAMMLFLTELSLAWYMRGLDDRRGPIGIGDISRKDGRQPGGHATHQHGHRVDICCTAADPNHRRDDDKNTIAYGNDQYDQARMIELVQLIRKLAEGRYQVLEFYYNDPVVQAVWPGKITTFNNHDEHLHMGLNVAHPYGAEAETLLSQSMLQRRCGF